MSKTKREVKYINFENFKVKELTEDGTFEGYASIFVNIGWPSPLAFVILERHLILYFCCFIFPFSDKISISH